MEEKEQQTNNQKEEADKKKEIIWGQQRVPNIKKGAKTHYPFVMMGYLALTIILSFIFARLTS